MRPRIPETKAIATVGFPRIPIPPRRALRRSAVLTLAALTAATAAACSSSPTTTASPTGSTSSLAQDCTAVTGVLANGPDPTTDSVGYAQAQILPLKQLKVTATNVQTLVSRLDAAFTAFVGASGSGAQAQAAVQVTSAENAVNAVCPGAAQ